MRYPVKKWLLHALFAISACSGLSTGFGQNNSAGQSAVPPPANHPALAELEARIAELEKANRPAQGTPGVASVATGQEPGELAQNTPIRDPALTTVDEQTGPVGGRTLGDVIREHMQDIQDPAITTVNQQTGPTAGGQRHWFDKLSIRGYSQFRLNEIPWYDTNGAPPQHAGDSSVALNQNFSIRRARIIISGDVSEHMYVYIQPDFAASVPGSSDAIFYSQLRDCYGDIYLDHDKIHRIRVGQSKVPYGWENLQSSSNRIPLDRGDALNSATPGERDLGVFYYYTPDFAQELFKFVLNKGLKGTGNYGMFGIGFYNGQGASLREQNENIHMAARFALPMQIHNEQVVEFGVQAYTGNYTVLTSPIQPLGVGPVKTPTANSSGYLDDRVAGTFVYYPQPIGFQAEWNVGNSPTLNDAQTAVIDAPVTGGYGMMMYRCDAQQWGLLFPFVRYNYYNGGYKSARNAPNAFISEWEGGVEWQFNPQMELTVQYTATDRTNTNALASGESYRQFVGDLVRIQFQMNY